jgi:hypothetical protein
MIRIPTSITQLAGIVEYISEAVFAIRLICLLTGITLFDGLV